MVVLKKILSVVCISAIMTTSANASMSDFISNKLGGSFTQENAGYYKSQASGFLTGGSARFRWGSGDTIQPFALQAPQYNIGCSGIDFIFGGFSYLNFEYLVDKMKKIASAAPAFAFQIALSTLCKDCETIMNELENIANAINSMNFDTCQMTTNFSKNIGKSLSEKVTGGQKQSWFSGFDNYSSSIKQELGQFTSWVNNSFPMPYDQQDPTSSPSNKLLEQFSIIKSAVNKSKGFFQQAFGKNEYEHILRALIGDLVGYMEEGPSVSVGNGENAEPKIMIIQREITPEQFIDLIWNKSIHKNGAQGDNAIFYTQYNFTCDETKCENPKTKATKAKLEIKEPMKEVINKKMDEIVEAIMQNQPVDVDFINKAPLPILDVLNLASTRKIDLGANTSLQEFIALLLLQSYIDELFFEANQVIAAWQNQSEKLSDTDKNQLNEFNRNLRALNTALQQKLNSLSNQIGDLDKATNVIRNLLQQGLSSNSANN